MLQSLLEDRLKLKIHFETREIPVYNLVVAKGGFKLQPMKDGSCDPFDPFKRRDPSEPRHEIGWLRRGPVRTTSGREPHVCGISRHDAR